MRQPYFCGVAMCAMALSTLPAFAQDASNSEVQDSVGLADIVVTAQRRTENVQKAALAISVISADALAQAGVANTSTLNAVAPSLAVVQGGGASASYFIRGVGNYTNNAYSDSAVAFNLDGVYIGRTTSTIGAFFDLERVEVLKGPQGTLYGRNATGGAINVLPAKPVLGELSGYLTAGYGNYDTFEGEAVLNAPLGDNTALRIGARGVRSDGFNRDGSQDNDNESARIQLLTQATDTLRIRLAADYGHVGGAGPASTMLGEFHFAPGAPASATAPANYVYETSGLGNREGNFTPAAQAYFAQQVIGGSFIFPAPLTRPYRDDANWGVYSEINLKTAVGDLTILPAYRKSTMDDNLNGPAFRFGLVDETDRQVSTEIRFDGERIGPVDWLVGGYFYDQRTRGSASYGQYLVTSIQRYDIETTSLAAFGRLTFHLADSVRFVAGGRYTKDKKVLDGSVDTLLNVCTNPPPPAGAGCFGGPSIPAGSSLAEIAAAILGSLLPAGFPTEPGPANARPFGTAGNILYFSPYAVNRTQKNNRFTYRLAIEADIGANSLAYASYETGYRSGGFSLVFGRETFNPEYIKALTLGIKNRFLDNRLQLNMEAFHWRYSGQQITHFGLDRSGLSNYFTENSGRSTVKGVDVDIQFKLARDTIVSGSLQYLDNRLAEFVYDTPRGPTALPPIVSCPYTPGNDANGFAIYRVDCAGKPGLNSPKWAFNIGVQQGFDIGDYRMTFTADGRYRSNQIIGFEYLPQQNSGQHFTADASVNFEPHSKSWSVNAWVRNLGDRDVPVNAQLNSTVAGTMNTFFAAPRTYGVRGTMRF
ncbi:TonB-dependent receptor [Sphingobium sp.]|uniref:TonB-dependent receptor n=1 Tax=Sphingobium sp. TaxID=1912891 RepID=UPI003BB687B7